MKRGFQILLFIICYCCVAAQTTTAVLKVTDDATQNGIMVQGNLLETTGSECKFVKTIYSSDKGELKISGLVRGASYEVLLQGAKYGKRTDGRYGIVGTMDYEPKVYEFTVPQETKTLYELPPVAMTRRLKTLLQEVTVTATKEKFYNKGDTLIYNAGAFMLPEGAMLDGLLEQMPGVKVQANGKITVNDNPVEGLLLNGKDVFNNNGQLMLENLGAYMVDDVAMYNKRNRDSELMGRSVGASPYVMDVRLKREYSQGLVVNAEGGYGTEDRYLGRLFGMSYSDNLALTVYGSANNLSDESTPGRNKDSSWTIADMGLGTVTRQQGGATYLVKDSDDWYELKGSVETINQIDDTRRLTSIEWYLQPTHIHEYRWLGQCERQFNVKTRHDWFFKFGDKANLTVTPLFRFDRNKRNSESMSVTMTEKLERVTHDGIAAIYSTDDSLKDKVLNRLKEEQTKEGTMLLARIEASSSIKLYDGDRSGGMLKLICWAGWNDSKNDRFDRYRLAYGDSAMSDMQHHRYYKQYPNYEKSLFGEVQYVQFTSFLNMQIPVTYNFQTTKRRNTVDMYALDRIPGYDPTDSGLDCLPSRDDYLSVLDPWESCMVEEVSHRHNVRVKIDPGPRLIGGYTCRFNTVVTMAFLKRNFNYVNGGIGSHMWRSDFLPSAKLEINLSPYSGRSWRWNLWANYNTYAPNVKFLISMPSKDPLVDIVDNKDLKKESHYSMGIRAERRPKNSVSHMISLDGNIADDLVSIITSFNPETGRQTRSIYNDRSSRNMDLSYKTYAHFDKKKRFSILSQTQVGVSYDEYKLLNRFNSYTYKAKQELRLGWQKNPFNISLFGNVAFNNYDYTDRYVEDFSAWTCNYGATALLKLPKGWDVSTDLTLYTRRGYSDSRLNTTDLVWNARVSKSLFKGALVLVADGYDLLRQLSNVSYTVNAQARTEVVSNVIPSYVLFHAQWRFNRQPSR